MEWISLFSVLFDCCQYWSVLPYCCCLLCFILVWNQSCPIVVREGGQGRGRIGKGQRPKFTRNGIVWKINFHFESVLKLTKVVLISGPPHMCSRSWWPRRRQVGRRIHSLTPHSYKRPNPLKVIFTSWMHYRLIYKKLLFTNDDVQEMPKVSVVARPHELAAVQNLPLSLFSLPSQIIKNLQLVSHITTNNARKGWSLTLKYGCNICICKYL